MTTASASDQFNEIANEYVYLDTVLRKALRMTRDGAKEEGFDKDAAVSLDGHLTALFGNLHKFIRPGGPELDQGEKLSFVLRLAALEKNELARMRDISSTFN